jgi:hypothetical protein
VRVYKVVECELKNTGKISWLGGSNSLGCSTGRGLQGKRSGINGHVGLSERGSPKQVQKIDFSHHTLCIIHEDLKDVVTQLLVPTKSIGAYVMHP